MYEKTSLLVIAITIMSSNPLVSNPDEAASARLFHNIINTSQAMNEFYPETKYTSQRSTKWQMLPSMLLLALPMSKVSQRGLSRELSYLFLLESFRPG